ncbi:uncharacterized protein LOC116106385 isoform X4 [Pistacia vera]|uniref:uncharacterized protein LOC116106385 isoform X4 n=1 Tax=Pistacia vera TaxID=55513 RepID=UPI001262C17E|nr:uncharacterized protein LOC116106385 isoform X4 [Pistacia vera]XP_031248609.1 uncharacterized protein LOC116106385 isoform X4 [Pistacia vera]XP_031248610.1 uncharacterized protein LOC116106385 isoform X4 [Pistacia vera]XP_031248612.1 uncharacterized protein LOC116106385 isoform X4 [Pistacia vera]
MLHRLPHDLLFRFHSPQHDGKERETKSWNSDCISIENNISSVQIKANWMAGVRFHPAKGNAPAVIFIKEVDAFAAARFDTNWS